MKFLQSSTSCAICLPTSLTYKPRHRRNPLPTVAPSSKNPTDPVEEIEEVYAASVWAALMSTIRVYWGRYFGLNDTAKLNQILVKVLGPEILDDKNDVIYAYSWTKLRNWNQ